MLRIIYVHRMQQHRVHVSICNIKSHLRQKHWLYVEVEGFVHKDLKLTLLKEDYFF